MIDDSDILEVCENAAIVALTECGIAEASALQQILDPVFDQLRAARCGVRYQVKKKNPRSKKEIKASIRAAFNGRNIDELVEQFGYSRASIYRIVRK